MLWVAIGTGPSPASFAAAPFKRFDRLSEDFGHARELLRVPGLAATVVEDGRVVWHQEFGMADLERRAPVTATTEFCVASITKTMAAIVLLQMVHERRLRLDEPIARYIDSPSLPKAITIRHVLSHTSDGNPGEEFLYNGARYALLSRVMEAVGERPFRELLRSRIFKPLQMADTLPGLDDAGYARKQARLARPYQLNRKTQQIGPGALPQPGLTAANGVVSTTRDLARYAIALDRGVLLPRREAALMSSPTRSTTNRDLPYGLGWFVQDYLGERIVWHFGQEQSYGSLLLRSPKSRLTLIVLANSNSISDAFRLLDGDAMRSLFALYFFRDVIAPRLKLSSLARRQLEGDLKIAKALAHLHIGQMPRATAGVRKAVATGSVERRPNLPLMYLLVQLGEPSLNPITENVGLAIVERHPRLPPALFFLATFYQQNNQSDRAIELFERIAGIQPPSEHWSTSLALVELGKWYLDRDPRRARAYLERVVDHGSNQDGALDTARGLLKQLRDG